MSDESANFATSSDDPAALDQIARERPAAPTGALQARLTWDASGEAMVEAHDPRQRRRNRGRELRHDTRKTAEYLAWRGPTPAEALHNVARMSLERACKEIAKHAGCTRWQAANFWKDCQVALLPYAHAKLDSLALAEGQAAGGLALAHWLAATVAGDRLSNDGPTFDKRVTSAQAAQIEAIPGESPQATLELLPEKPPD